MTLRDTEPLNDDYGSDLFGPEDSDLETETGDASAPVSGGESDLPLQMTGKRLEQTQTDIFYELTMSASQRESHVQLAREYERAYRMVDYDKSELLKPEARSIRTPLTTARVNKAHGSMMGALGVDPFLDTVIPAGSADGTAAIHIAAANNEEWERADGTSAVGVAIRNDLVHSIGYLKAIAVQADEEESAIIEVTSPDMQDMWLMPHKVRNLARCALIGERARWTMLEVKKYADAGFFDKEAVKKLQPTNTDWNGKDEVNDEFHDLEDNTSGKDSGEVEIFEIYRRSRTPDDSAEEMWRFYFCVQQNIMLRAEPWTDGIPYFPMRHDKVSNTIYSTPYPALTKDMQYSMDMLFSAALETDRMSVSPVYAVDPMSEAWQWIEESMENGESGISPGDVLPLRKEQLNVIQFQPAPMEIMNRFNQLQGFADAATVATLPTQTVKAATEIRYVVGDIQLHEQQMLKAYRDDLKNFVEYFKRLYWKYIAKAELASMDLGGNDQDGNLAPLDPTQSMKFVMHDSQAYKVQESVYKGMQLVPRGMTTKSNQILQQQTQAILTQFVMPVVQQQKAMQQAGTWAATWQILRRVCEGNDIQDYEQIIGQNPVKDPNLVDLSQPSPEQQNQAMQGLQIAQLNMGTGGGNPLQQNGQRGDGAQTASPGFAGANDQGPTN